jgi:hypothetical protein
MSFFPSVFPKRFKGLLWYPPDPEVDVGPIDARQVPQGNPLWFKLRTPVSGSKVCKLLGYFVPDPTSTDSKQAADAAQWSLQKREDFTGWKAVGVRFGRLREHNIVLSYLSYQKHVHFHECGFVPHPDNPEQWGASPDGVFIDPTMDWSQLPKETQRDFAGYRKTMDCTRGAAEFKSSRFNCKFNGYYIGQCIWEMQSLQVMWCDLIRYCERRQRDHTTGTWSVVYECKRIRLFRDAAKERKMLELVKRARTVELTGNSKAYMALVHSGPYKEMRAEFDQLAQIANQLPDEVCKIPVNTELANKMESYKRDLHNLDQHELVSLHPAMDRIEQRQADIFAQFQEQDKKECLQLILDQIRDYTELGEVCCN